MRPIGEARRQDLRDIERKEAQKISDKKRRYIDRILRAEGKGDEAEKDRLYAEAKAKVSVCQAQRCVPPGKHCEKIDRRARSSNCRWICVSVVVK